MNTNWIFEVRTWVWFSSDLTLNNIFHISFCRTNITRIASQSLSLYMCAEQRCSATRKLWWCAGTVRRSCASQLVGVLDSPRVVLSGEREIREVTGNYLLLEWEVKKVYMGNKVSFGVSWLFLFWSFKEQRIFSLPCLVLLCFSIKLGFDSLMDFEFCYILALCSTYNIPINYFEVLDRCYVCFTCYDLWDVSVFKLLIPLLVPVWISTLQSGNLKMKWLMPNQCYLQSFQ